MKIDDYDFEENPRVLEQPEVEEELVDLTQLLIASDEPVKKSPKRKVDARREVEEILLAKRYEEIYGDPFEDYGKSDSRK